MYLADSLAKIEYFEGKIPWLYLDSDVPGNVTCGVGFMLPNFAAACALPFQNGLIPATTNEIAAEFLRVSSMKSGMAAAVYRGPLMLTDEVIDAELMRRLQVVDTSLQMRLPNYEALPDSWKLALLDMAYNLGIGGLFKGYPHFIQAIKDQNWQAAMAQCNRRGPSMARNDWTRECFQP